jgi:Zn ribbon nucleic-acid-binding protein
MNDTIPGLEQTEDERARFLASQRYTCRRCHKFTVVWEPDIEVFVCTQCGYVDAHQTKNAGRNPCYA